ncbi:MAG: T9SS type A sorting domain-containing protein [Candidatus Marinimicrobia bacterium]|nr:T9SS type A sorting domain-containing protein [Candidatus Neomarinimicrobiota bacterium]
MRKVLWFPFVLLLATVVVFAQSWEIVKQGVDPAINKCKFIDSETGWLVGDEGLVRKTSDGGNTWTTLQEPVADSEDWLSVDFVNVSVGYACAEGGLIFKTEDGGENWTLISDSYAADMELVEAITEDLVYVAGEDSTFLKTTDGGANFTRSDYAFNGEDLDGGLVFTDANCGVVISDGNGGNTWYTHDGGESWNFVSVGPHFPPGTISSRLYDIGAAGDSTFVITGYHYVTLLSQDGGKTYQRIGEISYDFVRNELVDIITEDIFYIVGDYFAKTTDGGETWDTLQVGSAQSMIDIEFVDENTGFSFQHYGHWKKTSDGGNNWTALLDWPGISFWGLATPTDNKIVVSAWGGGEISISEDGGNTFSYPNNLATGAMNHLYECEFFDGDNGIVAGEDGFIAVTEDGGASWTSVENPMQDVRFGTYNALKYASQDTIYGSGDDGLIFRSADGGYSWESVTNEGENDILDFWTFGPNDVVSVGDDGQICVLEPGDTSFTIAYTTSIGENIRAVEFNKNGVGLFVSPNGYALRAPADEDTLYKVLDPIEDEVYNIEYEEGVPDTDFCDIYDVEFVKDTTVYIAGEDGIILKSDDTGLTWSRESSPITSTIQKLSYKNNILWAVGQGGNILKKNIINVGIEKNENAIPIEYSLEQNYPNPFNPVTNISFALPKAADVTLIVYNLMGQEVREIANDHMKAGKHRVTFDAKELSSGIYFYKLKAGNYTQIRKMTLLK